MTYLSTNFTLDELTLSQTASRMGIDNDPPLDVYDNLKILAYGMEEVRKELGDKPILISAATARLRSTRLLVDSLEASTCWGKPATSPAPPSAAWMTL